MKKKKYILPKTELLSVKEEGALLRATYIGYKDPQTGENHQTRIEDNDDDDFEAGAKKHDFGMWGRVGNTSKSLWGD